MEAELCLRAPSEWSVRSIADVCERVTSGGTPSRKRPEFFSGGAWPWVKTQELRDGWIEDTEEHITDEAVESSSAKVLPARTVLVALYGATVGQLGVLRREMTCNQACCAMIVDDDRADFRFLYYQLLASRLQLKSLAVGAAQQNLSGDLIKRFELPFPPVQEQRVIAHILGTLDDKIELNRRMNETLEQIARALFKSWFVGFDPVRAKSEGRDPGLPSEIADRFPDSFEESELGEIPKGWRVVPLPDAIDVNPTRVLRKGEVAPYLDMANMPSRGHSPDIVIQREFGSGMRFINGDTLVARITPCLENGKTAYVDFLEEGQVAWGSTEYIVLRPKPPLPTEFAYCLARGAEFRDFAIQSMTGSSGRQRVPAESLSHFHVVLPPSPVAELFGRLIKPLFASASAATLESRTLVALRDSLLPMLVSGELRVPDIERFAHRAD